MLKLTLDVARADTARRQIEGVAVPYGEVAHLAGMAFRFHPGSLRRARGVTPLLLGHDTNRPVGVVSDFIDGEDGARVVARVDRTADGDQALEQARSGSRGGLSIAFEVDDSTDGPDGVLDVHTASVYELSLVAVPAFAGAHVERVLAHREDDEPEPDPDPDPDQLELDDDDDEKDDDDDEADEAEESEDTMQDANAGAAPVILERRSPAQQSLSAGEWAMLLVRAQKGEREAQRIFSAALTETISTDVSGLLPPTYEQGLLGGKQIDRPLYTTFRSRALPSVGLQVNKPKWTTPPNGAWAANVDADATSAKVVVGSQAATVQRWDFAAAISWVVVQRSDPSIIDEIYAEAVQDFYLDVEAKIGGQLTPAAAGTSTKLGAAIAEFYVATGNQRTPEVIIMAPDVWAKFADAGALAMPVGAGGVSTSGGTLTSMFAGIPVVVSGTLAAGSTVLATRRAVDARISEPVQLTANAIGALNVEFAVVGEGLFDTDYPAELLKFAAIVPLSAEEATTAKAK